MRRLGRRILALVSIALVAVLPSGCGSYLPRLGPPPQLSQVYSASHLLDFGATVELTATTSPQQAASALAPAFLADPRAEIETWRYPAFSLKGSATVARWPWRVVCVMPVALPTTSWGEAVAWSSLRDQRMWVCVLGGPDGRLAAFPFARVGQRGAWRYGLSRVLGRDGWLAVTAAVKAKGAHGVSYKYVPFSRLFWAWVAVHPDSGSDFAYLALWRDGAIGIDNQQAQPVVYPLDAISRAF